MQVPATLQPAALASLAISRPLIAQAEDEKTLCHLVRIIAARFFSRMLLPRQALPLLLVLAAASPAAAQGVGPLKPLDWLAPLGPLDSAPDHLKRYTECMALARSEPLKALPVAEKWHGEGGGLAARHCVAVAMFEAGRYVQAAAQFEAIARDMGSDRPGLRAELWAQAGQAFIEAGAADKAAEAQSRAHRAQGQRPRPVGRSRAELCRHARLAARHLRFRPRADPAAQRRRDPGAAGRGLAQRAAIRRARSTTPRTRSGSRRIIPRRCSSAALPAWCCGERNQANNDFNRVLRLVPPDSAAARRAEAGLRGEQPVPPPAETPPPAPAIPKGGGKR